MTKALSKTSAPLPASYAAAKVAIATCARIDECKDWADKAKALAAYQKQKKDKALEHDAIRIRARAVDRAGALLKLVEAKHTGRPSKNRAGARPISSRKAAGEAAGMSAHDVKTALRVNSVERSVGCKG
jgi:hypothetical protein